MRIIIILLFILKSLLNHSQDINKIDSLINNGIKLNAYPGAQLFFKKGDFKNSENYANTSMSIPIYYGLKNSQIIKITNLIKSFFNEKTR